MATRIWNENRTEGVATGANSPPDKTTELRELIFDSLVQNCVFVDDCGKGCLSEDRRKCYGKQTDRILFLFNKWLEDQGDMTVYINLKNDTRIDKPLRLEVKE